MRKATKFLAIIILIAIISNLMPVFAADEKSTTFQSMENDIIKLFNKAREKMEMGVLEQNETLTGLARIKAEEMAKKRLDAPDFPDGIKQYLKDNLAESKAQNYYCTTGKKTAAEVVETWKKYVNFDRDTWAKEKTTFIGVGAAKGTDGKMYYVCIVTRPFGNKEKTDLEDEVIRLINEERKKQGLTILTKNDDLMKTAGMKAQDMADNGYCAHESPTYGKPGDMVKKYVPNVKYCGENIAAGQPTPGDVFMSWKDSPAHKAIMLKKTANCVGIGVSLNSKGNLIWSLILAK